MFVEGCRGTAGMLICPVTEFESPTASKGGDEHRVEVHKPQLCPTHEDIAMLKVAVGDMCGLKTIHKPRPFNRKIG
ncbi:MAG: hypothetical protein HYX95_02660 [Chloroflexi bacterium]|nr:hypothetical protein [Chloroflexota bacterium]